MLRLLRVLTPTLTMGYLTRTITLRTARHGRSVSNVIWLHPYSPIFIAMLDFRVKGPLPNQTFPLERSFAGNLPVNRKGHPNDTLFFWAYEKSYGSLTTDADEDCKKSVLFSRSSSYATCTCWKTAHTFCVKTQALDDLA